MAIRSNTPIFSLGLSARSVNALRACGVETYGGLIRLVSSGYDLYNIRGLGTKCINEILSISSQGLIEETGDEEKAPEEQYSFGEYLYKYANQRELDILVDYCNGGAKATLEVLGKKYGLTRERIRQLIKRCAGRLEEAVCANLIKSDIVDAIKAAAGQKTEISLLPRLDDAFTGPGLAYLIAHLLPKQYTIVRHTRLNGEWLTRTEDGVQDMIGMVISKLCYSEAPLKLSDLMSIFSIPEEMLMSIDGIIERDGYVTMSTNRKALGIDRNTIIANYLLAVGRPASAMELAKHTGLSENQIRGALQDKHRYVNVGKSVYDLVERDYENYSVNKLAANILTAEDRPLKLDDIIKYVKRYSDLTKSGISYNLIYAEDIKQDGEHFLLKEWTSEKMQKQEKAAYLLTLEDAIFDVVNSLKDRGVFDAASIREQIIDSYHGNVSTNLNSIVAALSSLASKGLVSRVGINTGCYARSNSLANSFIEQKLSEIAKKYELGLFLKNNIGKTVEIRYSGKRKNSADYWRPINVIGQDGRYIYTKNDSVNSHFVKYLKEKVIEFREAGESKPSYEHETKAASNDRQSSRGWYEDVKNCIARLGNTFTLNQVYGFEEELAAMHTDNANVQAKIRQQLQRLRDNYVIDLLQPGVYRKLGMYWHGADSDKLEVGSIYRNDELVKIFKVSSQGGMRKSNTTNSLVLIANHRPSNPYEDKWDGDVLNYTGMGLRGAQSINHAQNKTLAESSTNGVTVYLFESYANNEYIYRGVVELAGKPFFIPEKDEDGAVRTVLKFPIKIKGAQQ